MNAIVSLLDDQRDQLVRAIWAELQRELGVRRAAELVPFPHVTYHGAESYNVQRLEPMLAALAQATPPFTLRTGGLGIFSGAQLVLYIAVAPSPALMSMHQALRQAVADAATGVSPYYTRDGLWIPHITLAQWDISPANLPGIVSRLCERTFEWDVSISNLALLTPAGERYEVRRRYELGGAASGRGTAE